MNIPEKLDGQFQNKNARHLSLVHQGKTVTNVVSQVVLVFSIENSAKPVFVISYGVPSKTGEASSNVKN